MKYESGPEVNVLSITDVTGNIAADLSRVLNAAVIADHFMEIRAKQTDLVDSRADTQEEEEEDLVDGRADTQEEELWRRQHGGA